MPKWVLLKFCASTWQFLCFLSAAWKKKEEKKKDLSIWKLIKSSFIPNGCSCKLIKIIQMTEKDFNWLRIAVQKKCISVWKGFWVQPAFRHAGVGFSCYHVIDLFLFYLLLLKKSLLLTSSVWEMPSPFCKMWILIVHSYTLPHALMQSRFLHSGCSWRFRNLPLRPRFWAF